MVLTIMYDVGGQATNLHKNCHRVFVATPGLSLAKVMQAIGRVIRIRDTPGPAGVSRRIFLPYYRSFGDKTLCLWICKFLSLAHLRSKNIYRNFHLSIPLAPYDCSFGDMAHRPGT